MNRTLVSVARCVVLCATAVLCGANEAEAATRQCGGSILALYCASGSACGCDLVNLHCRDAMIEVAGTAYTLSAPTGNGTCYELKESYDCYRTCDCPMAGAACTIGGQECPTSGATCDPWQSRENVWVAVGVCGTNSPCDQGSP